MEHEFKTPVSMQVTQEQYDEYLEGPLIELGWIYDTDWNEEYNPKTDMNYLVLEGDTRLSFHSHSATPNCHFIDHYNPELFLALAAMTKGEQPIKGEYVIGWFHSDELYRENPWQVGRVHNGSS